MLDEEEGAMPVETDRGTSDAFFALIAGARPRHWRTMCMRHLRYETVYLLSHRSYATLFLTNMATVDAMFLSSRNSYPSCTICYV